MELQTRQVSGRDRRVPMARQLERCSDRSRRMHLLGHCSLAMLVVVTWGFPSTAWSQSMRKLPLRSKVDSVQPMTGIVLWSSNPQADSTPIQLEFSYLRYRDVVDQQGQYDWSPVDQLLDQVASRGHQAILRWHDTYVGKPTGVPEVIRQMDGYQETSGVSEGKKTRFPDWSFPPWRAFVLDFFTRFAERYDRDPRLAFVQVGFGLWAEYHIYDGPMVLGKTFPDRAFQDTFANHLSQVLQVTPWMISVDAAGDHAPFVGNQELAKLPFGLFDDSFNHRRHREENEPNWDLLGRERWKIAPTGGEFSFFERRDQEEALAPQGPYGTPFAEQARRFHVSFLIGDDQPRFQKPDVIRAASLRCGYRFRVVQLLEGKDITEVTIRNEGIAPIYYDAFPSLGGIRSKTSLKGLLPGDSITCSMPVTGEASTFSIECDRLVQGQQIQFDADLE